MLSELKYIFLDLKRELFQRKRRLSSLIFLNALSLFFLVGLQVTPQILQASMEDTFARLKGYDLQITSEFNFTAEDLDSLLAESSVKFAESAYKTQIYLESIHENDLIEVVSYAQDQQLNQLVLETGRLPENKGEAVVFPEFSEEMGLHLGETLTISAEIGDNQLEINEIIIVGTGYSPLYLSQEPQNSAYQDNRAKTAIFLEQSSFSGDYTHIYLKFHDSGEGIFSEEYQLYLKEMQDGISETAKLRWKVATQPYRAEVESRRNETENLLNASNYYWEMKLFDAEMEHIYASVAVGEAWSAFSSIEPEKQEEFRLNIQELEENYQQKLQDYQKMQGKAEDSLGEIRKDVEMAQRDLWVLEYGSWEIVENDALLKSFSTDLNQLDNFGKSFPQILFWVTIMVTLASLHSLIEEQRSNIGGLMALGYKKWEISLKYVGYYEVTGLIGGILGAIFGLFVLPQFFFRAWRENYLLLSLKSELFLEITLPSLVFLLILMGIFSFSLSFMSMGELPAAMLRQKPPKSGKSIFLESNYTLWTALNFRQKVAIRNLFRYKTRFFTSIASIGFTSGVVILSFGLKDSLQQSVSHQFQEIYRYTTEITTKKYVTQVEAYEIQGVLTEFGLGQSLASVYNQEVEICSDTEEIKSNLLCFTSADELSKVINLRQGRWRPYNMPETGVILPIKLAEELQVGLGDYITLKGAFGEATAMVTALSDEYVTQNIYITDSYYERITGQPVYINEFLVNYRKMFQYSPEKIRELDERLYELDGTGEVFHLSLLEEYYTDSVNTHNASMNTALISATLLAFLVLFHLNAATLTSRRMELCTLKVLGNFDKELSAYIYRENIILTFFGILAGTVVGANLFQGIIHSLEPEGQMLYRYLTISAYLSGAGITVVLSLIVNILSHFQLKSMNMVEELKKNE